MVRPSGRYFEELIVGEVIQHTVTRTATETDNLLITTLTMNTQLLHLDEEFAKKCSVAGTRLVPMQGSFISSTAATTNAMN